MSGWVYFIECGEDGPIKIGYAKNVDYRISNLQMGNPVELRLIGKAQVDNAETVEARLHAAFAADRIRGEWFHRSDELVNVALGAQAYCDNAWWATLNPEHIVDPDDIALIRAFGIAIGA